MPIFRTSPAEFIIPFDKYMKSAELDYSVGTRFRMVFEGEDCVEQRCQALWNILIFSQLNSVFEFLQLQIVAWHITVICTK